MKDFEIKDSFKTDKIGNYLFFLSFIAVHCSKESKLQQRKYPYEKYEDFYLSHSELFSGCEDSLKKVIAKNNKEDFLAEDYQSVIDEFSKRFITYRTGTIENWLQVIYLVLSFFGLAVIVASIKVKSLNIFVVSFLVTCAMISLFLKHFTVRRVILGKIKNPKKIISFFPINLKNVFKELDLIWNELKEKNSVSEKSLTEDDKRILDEVVLEHQLEKRNDRYYLINPVNTFLEWRDNDPRGKIYSGDLNNKFICRTILQNDGTEIKDRTLWEAKSRNKDKKKTFLD